MPASPRQFRQSVALTSPLTGMSPIPVGNANRHLQFGMWDLHAPLTAASATVAVERVLLLGQSHESSQLVHSI
jgi:hypothetical protein